MQTKIRLEGYNEQTTRFANRFPEWHPFRGKVNSNWRRLMSPVMGEILTDVLEYQSAISTGQHLSTTILNMPSALYVTPHVSDDDYLNDPVNLISNSDFSMDVKDGYLNWIETADGYTQYLSVQIARNRPFYLSVSGGSISKITLEGANITTGADYSYEVSDFSSVIDLKDSDARELTQITIEGDPAGAKIALWLDYEHHGWSRKADETPYWLLTNETDPYYLMGDGRRVYYTNSINDMYRRTPATYARISDTEAAIDEPFTTGKSFFDFKVEFFGTLYPQEFSVDNGQIIKTIDGSVVYRYTLEELMPNGVLDEATSEIIDIYLQDENIVALVRDGEEASSSSSSSSSSGASEYTYSLLWITPDAPEEEDNILTVTKRVALSNSDFLETGTISLIGTFEDPYKIFVSSTTDVVVTREIELKYDYYFIDDDTNDIVFREEYATLTGLSSYDIAYAPYFNLLDEHGLIRDFPRLEGESNYRYKNRMIDYSTNYATGCNNRDILNAITLRLGREIISSIISIRDNMALIKRKEMLYISQPDAVITETVQPDTNYAYVTLSYPIRNIISVKVDDKIYPAALYSHDEFSTILQFNHYADPAKTTSVEVQYRYYEYEIDLTSLSIGDLVRQLQAEGFTIDSEIGLTTMDTLRAINLRDVDGDTVNISMDYLPVRIDTFDEDAFAAFQDLSITAQELNRTHNRAIELRNLIHDTWDRQIAGRDRWDMISQNLVGGGTLRAYNDGFFSWLLDANGQLLGRVDAEESETYHVNGTKLTDIQSGVNATLEDFEIFKDLEVVGVADNYNPQVKPGFFYIGEMQFYLYIDKRRELLTDLVYYKLDPDSLSEALDGRELRDINNIVYCRADQELYIKEQSPTSSSSSLSSSASIYNLSLKIVDIDGTIVDENHYVTVLPDEHYFLSQEHNPQAPIIMTDHSVELQEVQFSIDENDKLTLLSDDVYTAELYIEYETDLTSEYTEIDYDIRYKRGFFYIKLTGEFSEALIVDTDFALYNGQGKGRHRIIYDPDETSSQGINYNPPIKIETDFTVFSAPSAPAYTSNDNYYDGDKDGWGYQWDEDFGN